MPLGETLVPEGAVHDLLGIRRAPQIAAAHISVLNALGQRWLNADDVARWLDRNAQYLNLPLLRTLRDELPLTKPGG